MEPIIKNLGKVSITANGFWDINKSYEKLSLVYDGTSSFISKKDVPEGVELNNEEYWQPFGIININQSSNTTKNIIHKITKTIENDNGEEITVEESISLDKLINDILLTGLDNVILNKYKLVLIKNI